MTRRLVSSSLVFHSIPSQLRTRLEVGAAPLADRPGVEPIKDSLQTPVFTNIADPTTAFVRSLRSALWRRVFFDPCVRGTKQLLSRFSPDLCRIGKSQNRADYSQENCKWH